MGVIVVGALAAAIFIGESVVSKKHDELVKDMQKRG